MGGELVWLRVKEQLLFVRLFRVLVIASVGQVLSTTLEMHTLAGILHGDICPDNIVISSNEHTRKLTATIIDFGGSVVSEVRDAPDSGWKGVIFCGWSRISGDGADLTAPWMILRLSVTALCHEN